MRRAIVLDLDGVLFDTSVIFEEICDLKLTGDAKWDYFHEHCDSDRIQLLPGVKELLTTIYNDLSVALVIMTARNEKVRQKTMNKLLKNKIYFDHLYMRKDGDYRPSPEVKRDYLLELMQRYRIEAFIDDDLSNCQMAKELGILALRRV